MKKVLLLLAVLMIVLPLSARPKLELALQGSPYFDGGFSFGFGGNLIVNPKKQFGIRVNLAEILLGDMDGISINSISNSFTTFDVLYYTNLADLFTYISFTFGYSNVFFDDMLTIGGGIALEKYLGKGNYAFIEPGLVYMNAGGGADELIFRIPFGVKLGI